jgi:type IV pilus assembly protein PilC
MSFMVTPGQLTARSEFYHQLGQMTAAGLGLMRALEQQRTRPPSGSYRRHLEEILADLGAGCTFADALRRQGSWLPEFDIALVEAGEQSGRIDLCLGVLAEHYRERAQMARQVIGSLLYPVALLHFAVFIFPFAKFFTSGDWRTYLAQTFGVLLPLYVVGVFLIFALQGSHPGVWRSIVEAVLRRVPVLGTARHYLALARLAGALEALLSAGVTIIEAWGIAARASGGFALRRHIDSWKQKLVDGQVPSEMVNDSSLFPELFANQYAAGEVSGTLDDSLRRVGRYYQEEGTRKMKAFAVWTPLLFYLVVVLMIAWRIIAFYMDYFGKISEVLNF